MQYLRTALDQGNSEWPRDFIEEAAPGEQHAVLADALDLDSDETTLRTWERAMLRALAKEPSRSDRHPGTFRELRAQWLRTADEALRPSDVAQSGTRTWDEVDLTVESIKQASLLDHEGRELGEVRPPSVLKTDDTGLHGRPRGGYLRPSRRRRASPSAHSGKTLR